jgi:hypothetical protein
MKNSLSLQETVDRLKDERLRKRDMVVPSTDLMMTGGMLGVVERSELPRSARELLSKLSIELGYEHGPTRFAVQPMPGAYRQIAEKLDIDWRYFQKCLDQGPKYGHGLLDTNVNYWLPRVNKSYMLRMFVPKGKEAGVLRAMLGDRFFVLDHWDVLMTALEVIRKMRVNVAVEACALNETKMYVRFLAPEIEVQAPEILKHYKVPGGHRFPSNPYGVRSGFILRNSETGHGRFQLDPRIMILACENGYIRAEEGIGRVHLGAQLEEGVIEWSETTKRKAMELVCSQVEDAVKMYLSKEYLNGVVEKVKEKGLEEVKFPSDAIKNVGSYLQLTEDQTTAILNHFIDGGDRTAFGVAQAVTYYAHEVEDADLEFQLEASGLELVEKMSEFDKPFVKKGKKNGNPAQQALDLN